uniref:Ubiquitin-conjugating enzyme E2 Q2 n=1 Tax=Aceria tosichella TaxID=561515 RepID=A0A6G1SB81_9ACAR
MSFIRYSRGTTSIMLVVVVVVALAILVQDVQSMEERRASTRASKRLMNELKGFHESDSYKNGVFTVELVDENIFEWQVKIFKFDPESPLHKYLKKMKELGKGDDHFILHISYPYNYPTSPPRVGIRYPVLGSRTNWSRTSNGHPVCVDLLEAGGWCSAYTIEPLILNLATHLSNNIAYSRELGYLKQDS